MEPAITEIRKLSKITEDSSARIEECLPIQLANHVVRGSVRRINVSKGYDVFRFCEKKFKGYGGNAMVGLNACLNCPHAIKGEPDITGVIDLSCELDKSILFGFGRKVFLVKP